MRRAFHRRLGVGPSSYRERFLTLAPSRKQPDDKETQMDIAIPIFDRFTALDAVGPYEVLSRLPDARVTFIAKETGPYKTDNGMLSIVAEARARRHAAPRRDHGPRRHGHPRR